jgi:hypothetical protein
MSLSTVSTINKYLLTSSDVSVSVLLGTNVTFPDDFNGVRTEFNSTASQNHNDCRKTFSVSGDASAWKNSVNGYYLLAVSYNYGSGTNTKMSVPMLYCNLAESGSALRCWGNQGSYNATFTLANYLDGVNIGNYTTDAIYSTNGQTYVGGGTGKFWTIMHEGIANWSVSGEWFEQKFPFKVKMTSLSFMCRNNASTRCVQDVRILGSDDGINWWFVYNLTYSAYSNGIFQTKPIYDDRKFQYIRFVVTKTIGLWVIQIQQMKMTFDAYSL